MGESTGVELPDDLVAAARAGERGAFEELVRRTYVDTFTLARRLTGDDEDAADVTQEVYVRAWRGIARFRGEAAVSTWLYRITANVASTHRDRRRRHATATLDEVAEPEELDGARLPESAAATAFELRRIADALDELPPKLRAAVVLKDVYDLPHDDIAHELGISVTAAKVRLHRGRKALRDRLADDEERAARAG